MLCIFFPEMNTYKNNTLRLNNKTKCIYFMIKDEKPDEYMTIWEKVSKYT